MIVLTILKWIGIVLLWILGILLALILLLLFSPIRYHVNADIDPEAASEGDKAQDGGGKPLTERAHVSAGVRYLLSAVRARFDWPTQEGQEAFSVSVLFFRVFPRKEKKASGRRKRGKKGSRGERQEDLAEQSSIANVRSFRRLRQQRMPRGPARRPQIRRYRKTAPGIRKRRNRKRGIPGTRTGTRLGGNRKNVVGNGTFTHRLLLKKYTIQYVGLVLKSVWFARQYRAACTFARNACY